MRTQGIKFSTKQKPLTGFSSYHWKYFLWGLYQIIFTQGATKDHSQMTQGRQMQNHFLTFRELNNRRLVHYNSLHFPSKGDPGNCMVHLHHRQYKEKKSSLMKVPCSFSFLGQLMPWPSQLERVLCAEAGLRWVFLKVMDIPLEVKSAQCTCTYSRVFKSQPVYNGNRDLKVCHTSGRCVKNQSTKWFSSENLRKRV